MDDLARVVREVLVASDRYRQTMAASLGIGVNEFAVLGHLLHNGPQTPTLIAARVGLTPTSTTALIDRMAGVRLVVRSPHPVDRRRTPVSLTGLGHDAVAALYAMFSDDIGRALDRADLRLREDEELRRLVGAVLTTIAAALRERAGDRLGVEAALDEATATAAEDPGSASPP